MGIKIGQIEFAGPFASPDDIEPVPGIYGIVCQSQDELLLLDIGDSLCLRECLEPDEFTSNLCFYEETCHGSLLAVVHYMPTHTTAERRQLKAALLDELEAALALETTAPDKSTGAMAAGQTGRTDKARSYNEAALMHHADALIEAALAH